MRRGELCGLSWDDVNLDTGRITVRWQITQRSYAAAQKAENEGRPGRYRTRPKTLAGEDRIIDLDAASVEVLRTWRRTQLLERLEWGSRYAQPIDDHGDLVFICHDGRPLDPGRTYRTFVTLVRDTGLSHLKLHGLRHLNISLQLEAGVSETIIAMRVGHTTPALIRSTYGHLIGTIGQQAAEATAALVPRKIRTGEDHFRSGQGLRGGRFDAPPARSAWQGRHQTQLDHAAGCAGTTGRGRTSTSKVRASSNAASRYWEGVARRV